MLFQIIRCDRESLQPEPTAILRSSDAGELLKGKWIWTAHKRMTKNWKKDTERGLAETRAHDRELKERRA